jgi:hypothetical protein
VNSRYVKKIIEHHLIGHCRPELALLVEGFHDVIPRQLLHECQINAIELELIVAGLPDDLDVADWRRHTNFQCNNHSAELEEWFWTAVAEMTAEDRAKLLSFTCGTSRLPFGGFAALEPPFQVDIGGNPSHLPLLMVNLHIATHSDAGFGFL